MATASDDQVAPRSRILLGSGAFHLEANRTRLLAGAMREHFGDTVPKLLFIPYAAADGDYDTYVKRTIELVRLLLLADGGRLLLLSTRERVL